MMKVIMVTKAVQQNREKLSNGVDWTNQGYIGYFGTEDTTGTQGVWQDFKVS
jgi:hypothetical protein